VCVRVCVCASAARAQGKGTHLYQVEKVAWIREVVQVVVCRNGSHGGASDAHTPAFPLCPVVLCLQSFVSQGAWLATTTTHAALISPHTLHQIGSVLSANNPSSSSTQRACRLADKRLDPPAHRRVQVEHLNEGWHSLSGSTDLGLSPDDSQEKKRNSETENGAWPQAHLCSALWV
jgi:hypothetical protein